MKNFIIYYITIQLMIVWAVNAKVDFEIKSNTYICSKNLTIQDETLFWAIFPIFYIYWNDLDIKTDKHCWN